jgi:uncharacterized protein (TIGR02001 family)
MKTGYLTILALSLATSAITISPNAFAVEGLSANIGATNNYIWRGLEQTHGDAAVSGGIDYVSQSGFYIGTWTSNADWATSDTTDSGMSYELDVYGGYTGKFSNFDYDIGFTYYAYPDSDLASDFTEVFGNITHGVLTLGYATLANADGYSFGDDSFISADIDLTFASDIALNLHIGTGTNDFYAGESFIEYGMHLSKNNFSFGFSKNDLDGSEFKAVISYTIDIDL